MVWYWQEGHIHSSVYIILKAGAAVDLQPLSNIVTAKICVVQLVFGTIADVEDITQRHPEIPHLGGMARPPSRPPPRQRSRSRSTSSSRESEIFRTPLSTPTGSQTRDPGRVLGPFEFSIATPTPMTPVSSVASTIGSPIPDYQHPGLWETVGDMMPQWLNPFAPAAESAQVPQHSGQSHSSSSNIPYNPAEEDDGQWHPFQSPIYEHWTPADMADASTSMVKPGKRPPSPAPPSDRTSSISDEEGWSPTEMPSQLTPLQGQGDDHSEMPMPTPTYEPDEDNADAPTPTLDWDTEEEFALPSTVTFPEYVDDDIHLCREVAPTPTRAQIGSIEAGASFFPTESEEVDEDPYVEFYFQSEFGHWSTHCRQELRAPEQLVLTISHPDKNNKVQIKGVVQRELHNLSKEEIVEHADEVSRAKLEELKRWHDLGCFQRMKRSKAQNKVDGTWVLKWKKVRTADNEWNKIIKARLTARGFKDMQAFSDKINTYSGTATKWSQRMINAHAAQNDYVLFSMDISAAFLKGLTFKEIQQLTGEPLRSVQFDFPAQDAWILQQLPCMSDYDYHTDLIKALWGLKDAPRAFGLRLSQTLLSVGYKPSIVDPQVWRKYLLQRVADSGHGMTEAKPHRVADSGHDMTGAKVVSLLSTHIDDIKGSASEKEQNTLLNALRKDYGNDVKIEKSPFEHTGIKHEQRPNGDIYTHQNHYVKEITEVDMSKLTPIQNLDDDLPEAYLKWYWSLLGALGWLLQTRADIAPFIGNLQRAASKPKIRHLRLANRVLRYCRRVPTGLIFRKLKPPLKVVVVADSAYSAKEDSDECLALRGWIVLLVGKDTINSHEPGGPCMVLDWVSRKFSTVTRSSFAAELRNQLEAGQAGMLYAAFFEEHVCPDDKAIDLANKMDDGSLKMPVMLAGDNKGVFQTITAQNPKAPTEPLLTPHIRAIRDFLDRNLLNTLFWIDNRDMIADPLTKGKTRRNILNDVLSTGRWKIEHPTEYWKSTKGSNGDTRGE